jgi:chromate reductase
MIRLVGLAGSLREKSFNAALLKAAAEVAPSGVDIDIRPINAVPLYDQDREDREGIPEVVAELKEAIAASSGLVIATPEYNAGIPGVLKNAIDWISRPIADQARVLNGKSVALLGATPGGFGTTFAQSAWLPVFRTLRMTLWVERGPFYVSGASTVFNDDGLNDTDIRARLGRYMGEFIESL